MRISNKQIWYSVVFFYKRTDKELKTRRKVEAQMYPDQIWFDFTKWKRQAYDLNSANPLQNKSQYFNHTYFCGVISEFLGVADHTS